MSFAQGFSVGFNAVMSGKERKDKEDEKKREQEFEKALKDAVGGGDPTGDKAVVAGGVPAAAASQAQPSAPVAPQGAAPVQPQGGAAIVASGIPAPQPQAEAPKQEDFKSLHQKYQRLQELAVTNPKYGARAKDALDVLRQRGISQYMAENVGEIDPTDGKQYMDNMRHYYKAQSLYGDPITPEQHKQLMDADKAFKESGFDDMLKAAKRYDMEGAEKAWNASTLGGTGKIIGISRGEYSDGFAKFETPIIQYKDNETGEIETVSVADLEMQRLSVKERLALAHESQKAKTGKKKDEADIAYKEAQTKDIDTDNKRADKQMDINAQKVLEGANDSYLVSTDPEKLGAVALGIGAKSSKKGTGTPRNELGLTESEMRSRANDARKIVAETQYGAESTLMKEVQKIDPNAWSEIEYVVGDLVERGYSVHEASYKANKLAIRMLKALERNEPDAVAKTMKEYKAMAGKEKDDDPINSLRKQWQ